MAPWAMGATYNLTPNCWRRKKTTKNFFLSKQNCRTVTLTGSPPQKKFFLTQAIWRQIVSLTLVVATSLERLDQQDCVPRRREGGRHGMHFSALPILVVS